MKAALGTLVCALLPFRSTANFRGALAQSMPDRALCAHGYIALSMGTSRRKEPRNMNELIRTLAAFGRPFPPELREIYLRLEKDPKHPRGPSGVATGSADAVKGEP